MLYAVLPPDWLRDRDSSARPQQAYFTFDELLELNAQGYNCYYYPNHPSEKITSTKFIDGTDIDVFEWVFVDMDLKEGKFPSKAAFIENMLSKGLQPSRIVDTGNGVHAYWRVVDLDAMSFLRLQRRLCRFYVTDDAVAKIKQLMRVPDTLNMKDPENPKLCEELFSDVASYTCEQLDKALPLLTREDEDYCQAHYNKTYALNEGVTSVDDRLPPKFGELLTKSAEAKDIWSGLVDDRSKGDFRLGHLMFAAGFTKAEAMSVLVNSAKALGRAPTHRISYAEGIVEKIWTFELAPSFLEEEDEELAMSVQDILRRTPGELEGARIKCWRYIDNTHKGLRLGQVVGLVAGVGVGKTAMALNMFQGFVHNHPELDHMFISLEQPHREIADRWKDMCGEDSRSHSKVFIIDNYKKSGGFRNLSMDDIREYIVKYQKKHNRKIGCVVIDHIGALKKKNAKGENQDLMDICHSMKSVAIETNTLIIMQSQAPREKAGIGDLELDKDAAYGTVYFEAYCDYLVTIWQPLKRAYSNPSCPAVTAFKFCKIRHKKKNLDALQEDVRYRLVFDPGTERMRELTQDEEKLFDFYNKEATNKRKQDKKTDVLAYTSLPWAKETDGEANNNKDSGAA